MQRVVLHRAGRVPVRLLPVGQVSALRSQTLYHAVAECATASDAPTLCVVYPGTSAAVEALDRPVGKRPPFTKLLGVGGFGALDHAVTKGG